MVVSLFGGLLSFGVPRSGKVLVQEWSRFARRKQGKLGSDCPGIYLDGDKALLFNSYQFIFVFLPITLIGYFALRAFASKTATLIWLTATSLIFYAAWNPWNLPVLFTSIGVNFFLGTVLAERARASRSTKCLLALGIAFNLGLLGYFKYAGFFATNVNAFFGTDIPVLTLVLPLAISFFTFQEIAYLVDSSRGETYGYRFSNYLLFVTVFPQLIAGPIVSHRTLMPQFISSAPLKASYQTFALGIGFLVFGLTKKVLLADNMALHANHMFDSVAQGSGATFAEAWIGAFAYSLQLYFDFSGYSDMAIGLGLLFGIRLPINFNSPYQAISIVDFWRRWHMTLSAFLRDYLYVGLGGNRHGEGRRYLNLGLTMLLGGLWHGAGWTFVFWGAFHGAGLAACHFWNRMTVSSAKPGKKKPAGVVLSRAVTLVFVVFGWVLFRADSMSSAGTIIGTMVGVHGLDFTVNSERLLATASLLAFLVALMAIALLAPNSQQWLGYNPERPLQENSVCAAAISAFPLHGAALGFVFVFVVTQMSAVQSFLYFQF